MNHKILFFLSVIIIAVGLTGIIIQKKQGPTDDNVSVVRQSDKKKVIAIAETLKDIRPRHILTDEDYQIRVLEVEEEVNDIRSISSLGTNNLNGYLVLTGLPKNSAILPEMVEAPGSKSFVLHSLEKNVLPYDYRVKSQDESLLTTLSIGDEVSLYIRVVENDQRQGNNASGTSEINAGPNNPRPSYAISRLTGPLTIIEIKRDKNQTERNGYSQDETVGSIVLRMNREQLAELRVAEKAGEILLFPADGDRESYKKVSMDEVLKQFRAVKELRGGK